MLPQAVPIDCLELLACTLQCASHFREVLLDRDMQLLHTTRKLNLQQVPLHGMTW